MTVLSMRPVNVTIDARGADEARIARVQQQIADLKASLPGTIVKQSRKRRNSERYRQTRRFRGRKTRGP